MNRIEVSLTRTRAAIGWRHGLRSGIPLALGLLCLSGCPENTETPADGSPTPGDMRTQDDGGNVNMQQAGCSKDAWCWMFPQPQGNTLRSVWGSSASDAWAVGDGGALLHYANNEWKSVVSPTSNPLQAVWGASATDVYAAGDRGTVLHYDGTNWTVMPVMGGSNNASLYSIWGSGSDVWIVGASGTVLRKSGDTLARVPQSATNQVLLSVWGTGSTIYAVGNAGMLLKYDGATFTATPIGGGGEILLSIVGTGPNNIFVSSLSGSNGFIRHSTDGVTFNEVQVCTTAPASDPPIGCRLFNSFGINALWAQGSDVFAVGDPAYTDTVTKDATHRQGTFKKWDGSKFAEVPGAPPVTFYGLWGSSPSSLFAVGASGTIVSYNGSSFSSSSPVDLLTGVSANMAGVTGSSSSDLYAVGDWGTTLKWGGSSWNKMNISPYVRFRAVSGSGSTVFSIAFDEMMRKPVIYQLIGSTWTAQNTTSTREPFGLWSSGEDAVAVGDHDTILRRDTTSKNWVVKALTASTDAVLRGVWGTAVNKLFIVGGGDYQNNHPGGAYPGKIMTFNGDEATEVSGLPTRDTLFAIWGADTTHVWAVGDNGVILATTDGVTWSQQPSGTPFPLRGVWGTSATNVYAVGVGGTILRYDGQAWKMLASGTTATLTNIWGVGKTAYASGGNGAVLRLTLP